MRNYTNSTYLYSFTFNLLSSEDVQPVSSRFAEARLAETRFAEIRVRVQG